MNFINLSNKNIYQYIFIAYLFILVASSFTIIPYIDSYYYWLWSKNLQLSYVDGPPLIAYVIKSFAIIFGNNVFALNFLGVVVTLISSFVVMQISRLLRAKHSFAIALLWLTSYSVTTHRIITSITYDGLVNLFELSIVLSTLKYFHTKKNYFIYLIGIFAGLALLSKYTSIILIIALVAFFLYQKELRIVFKQIHFYLAMLLCLIIFSPVLAWNYEHQWASFIFQLNYHTYNAHLANLSIPNHILQYFLQCVIAPMAPILVILFAIWIKNYKKSPLNINNIRPHSLDTKFISTTMLSILIFWLLMSIHNEVSDRFMLLFHSLIIIFAGIILLEKKYYKIFLFLLMGNAIWSTGDMVSHSLKTRSPNCYNAYVKSGLLKFNSPFIKYIKAHPQAETFCRYEIRQNP
ncbi:MAG: putative glycosyl transferase [Burkholderiales bacterium]|nr:putative glycosyl transferase [Burkholderiales bacterium]